MTVDDAIFGELDLSMFTAYFGEPLAGIIGYDLLARCVAEIDTTEGRIALYDPGSYELPDGRWQELFIGHGHPHVRATFEGNRDGIFRLDTGNPGALLVHAPTVMEFSLLEGRKTRPVPLGGAGGSKPAQLGTLQWFELGEERFENARAIFSQADTGSMTSRWTAGTIGTELMRPFNMVFDCPRKRIAFLKLRP